MTGIWANAGEGWELLDPNDFPDEATLHDLIANSPAMLPLAGSPQLVIVGREVQLGNGYVDLLAVETTGRLALIEIKLGRNAEARRAVVAQVLAYASFLHGWELDQLESGPLARHLRERGFVSLYEAAGSIENSGLIDVDQFEEVARSVLENGHFRLVIVLDSVPTELSSLVAYLESVTDGLIVDLVAIRNFNVGAVQVVTPQRVQPQRAARTLVERRERAASQQQGQYFEDSTLEFEESIGHAPEQNQDFLRNMLAWMRRLEAIGLCNLSSYRGRRMTSLLPQLLDERVGLVTLYNDRRTAYLSAQRSVMERRSPRNLERLETLTAPAILRNGSTIPNVTEEFLSVLEDAYREANNLDTKS